MVFLSRIATIFDRPFFEITGDKMLPTERHYSGKSVNALLSSGNVRNNRKLDINIFNQRDSYYVMYTLKL